LPILFDLIFLVRTEEFPEAQRPKSLQSGLESDDGKLFLSYLSENSKITQMVKRDTTSSLTFEYLYRKEPVTKEIDKYSPRGEAAMGIFERLQALKANLPEIIREDIKTQKIRRKYHVLNIGSGPGHDIIETLQQNPDLAAKVQVTCLDPDGETLAIGKKRVEELGLIDSFTFIQEALKSEKAEKG
jgi:hypothetical protein